MGRRTGSGVQAWRARNAATERSVDDANAAAAAARRAEVEVLVVQAKREALAVANAPAVDASELVVGRQAIDRRRRVGAIVRVNATTVTLRDLDGLEWRPRHDDILRTQEAAA